MGSLLYEESVLAEHAAVCAGDAAGAASVLFPLISSQIELVPLSLFNP